MPNLLTVGQVSDIPLETVRHYDIEGEPVVIAHTSEGFFALEDRCSHADVALSEGDLDGCMLECWLHGAVFDVRTGVPATLPALVAVKTYDVFADPSNPESPIEVNPTPNPIQSKGK